MKALVAQRHPTMSAKDRAFRVQTMMREWDAQAFEGYLNARLVPDLHMSAIDGKEAAPSLDDSLICFTSFEDGARYGFLNLQVSRDYRPDAMRLTLHDPDGSTRAQIDFDPTDRKLPGTLSSMFFAVRFTQTPAFPLLMKAYADGQLRWQKTITVPFWPSSLAGSGTLDYLSKADDGLPVSTPSELNIVLTDAKQHQVGTFRYPLLKDDTQAAVSSAIAQLDRDYREHRCNPPPPPIDSVVSPSG